MEVIQTPHIDQARGSARVQQLEMFPDVLEGLSGDVAAGAAANLRSLRAHMRVSGAEFWAAIREAESALEAIGHERMTLWLAKHLSGQYSVPELRRFIKMRRAIEARADGNILLRTTMEIGCGSFTAAQVNEITQDIEDGISPEALLELVQRGRESALASRERGPNESTVAAAVYEFLRCDPVRRVEQEVLLDMHVRADLVTWRAGVPEFLVEVKRVISEQVWYAALGQLAEYSGDPHLAGAQVVLAYRDFVPELEPRMLVHADRTGLRLLHVDPTRNIQRWVR
jgi:hypothetical protein